ncbi:pre-mRNA-splicing factor CWC22 homolog [Bacillus rossius redtenbacheri]|uniref:pre-mRNA-splicing factor CWC22 homolog n=1 Tax=Bacillus rossius redtenbacheri TaxID=93214 RepID=UPI002FDD605D
MSKTRAGRHERDQRREGHSSSPPQNVSHSEKTHSRSEVGDRHSKAGSDRYSGRENVVGMRYYGQESSKERSNVDSEDEEGQRDSKRENYKKKRYFDEKENVRGKERDDNYGENTHGRVKRTREDDRDREDTVEPKIDKRRKQYYDHDAAISNSKSSDRIDAGKQRESVHSYRNERRKRELAREDDLEVDARVNYKESRGSNMGSTRERHVERSRGNDVVELHREDRRFEDRSRETNFDRHTESSFNRRRENDNSKGKRDSLMEQNTKLQKKTVDMLTSRTGGAYIPPAKLRMMQAQITDKSSAAYQRIAWEALKKSIHGLINKINTSNIGPIVRDLFKENIVRGRGLLCRSIIQAQAASPTFTHVYAALVAVINSKFPNIGELLLRRLVLQFRRGFKRNDKATCISAATFVAHLVNQSVAHEILALEILTLLVESPTDDSVEVAIAFLKECGMKLLEVSNKGVTAIFEMLRNILHEGHLDKRVQYMIEVIFQVRKDEFKAHPSVLNELDIVEEEDQFTHLINLDEVTDSQDILNVFKFDPEYEASEAKYAALRKEILDEDSEGSEGEGSGSQEDSEEEQSENGEAGETTILDNTETNLVALRRTIYLTIHSSLDFEECAHKLMRMELKPGQEIELCHMFLDCCAEQRTYEKFFGLLAQRFCMINKIYIPPFQQIFKDTYDTIHRLDTNKLRNVAKFFAHLLFTDAISWEVLSFIRLNEEETTSSSRIFIKILFQELSEYMGLTKLNERVKDPTLQLAFDGVFPRDNPKNTRFAINFFTSIGLGGLTDELREHLKAQPKTPLVPKLVEALASSNESDSSDESSDSDSSNDSSSESEKEKQRHKKPKKSKKSSQKKSKKKKKKKKIKT